MPRQPSVVALFFGYAMIAVGVLMLLLSGGCTLFFVYVGGPRGLDTALPYSLPFIALGVGLTVIGRILLRRPSGGDPPDETF